jgi:hypothetical protein
MLNTKLKQMKRRRVEEELQTIYAMVQMTKQSSKVIKYLSNIRINPKLSCPMKREKGQQQHIVRADLEFYIPQIVAHYLRTDIDDETERQIEAFLLFACESNYFFAHKVWFYLRACLISRENGL